jgi:aspartyl-tRNA(Asn)/glutamyl-tRNA(Gln) amidotransferase subunit C
MANLDKKPIKKLTQLCTEEEQESLLQDLEKTLSYIELLQEINTDDVFPCNQVLENMGNVREDVIGEVLDRDVFLAKCSISSTKSWTSVKSKTDSF